MNADYATLTGLAAAQSGSMVGDDATDAPASSGFDLIIGAALAAPWAAPARPTR